MRGIGHFIFRRDGHCIAQYLFEPREFGLVFGTQIYFH